MYTLTGRQATLFRPPYGEYDSTVVKVAAAMGLTTIEYDLPSGDPDVHAIKEKLIEYVVSKAKNGSIIVMHIKGARKNKLHFDNKKKIDIIKVMPY